MNDAASYIIHPHGKEIFTAVLGPAINAIGILLGGIYGLAVKKPLSARFQLSAKLLLGVATVWFGLQLTWRSLNGSFGQIIKELCIALLAMSIGRIVGRLFRLQDLSNSIGKYATRAFAHPINSQKSSEGFVVATALFCIGPLALLSSVQEGFTGVFSPVFAIKAGTDALATISFCAAFGWSPALAALPVFAVEGFFVRCFHAAEPTLHNQPWPLLDSINATNGLLIFCVALIVLEIKKVRVAEYFPSLLIAPILTRWLW